MSTTNLSDAGGLNPAQDEAAASDVCRTKLISDSPSDEDKFGTHRRVADSIAQLISSGADGVSVGVEGDWGSGKTTVYKLLAAALDAQDDYKVVLFDAWAHEGDPLRLTFLQSVTRRLAECGWIEGCRQRHTAEQCGLVEGCRQREWEKRLEEIASRRQTEVTKEHPSLSPAGVALSLALLLAPLSVAFANAALRDDRLTLDLQADISARAAVLFGFAAFFAVLPFLIGVVTWLWMRARGRKNFSPWSLFFTKGVAETRKETLKTPNPTSIDFEQTFEDLMAEALGESPDSRRRLVLVFDNLDRVDSEVALSIWSTLQTFLKHRSGGAAWARRLWVVALYDPHGLSLIWEEAAAEDAAQPSADGAREGAAQSFMDKSFQVRFEVAAPILSDWRDFLVGLLREALPDHVGRRPADGPADSVEPEFHAIYRVLAIYLNRRRRLPTIRELKLYVNQIGVIHRQWSKDLGASPPREADAFPLSHMAYYALLRRRRSNVVRGLLATSPRESLPETEYADLLGEGITENLAALAFNVNVKLAGQLLIGPTLKGALTQDGAAPVETLPDGAVESLKALADSHPRAFWDVLEETVRAEWSREEAPKAAAAAFYLERSGLLEGSAQPGINHIKGSLCALVRQVEAWTSLDERQARGLAAVLRWSAEREPSPARAKKYLTDVAGSVAAGFSADADVRQWVKLTSLLLEELRALNASDAFDEGLVKRLSDELIPPPASQPTDGRTMALLEALLELREVTQLAEQRLRERASDGRLLLRWPVSSGPKAFAAMAWVAFAYLRTVRDAHLPADASDALKSQHALLLGALQEPNEATVNQFAELVKRYGELGTLFQLHRHLPDARRFVGLCLKLLLEDEDAATLFPPLELIMHWPLLDGALGTVSGRGVLDSHVQRLISRKQLVGLLTGDAFDPALAGLYRAVVKAGGSSPDPEFSKWLADSLRLVGSERWLSELDEIGQLFSAAYELKEAGVVIALREAYYTALVKHARARLVVTVVDEVYEAAEAATPPRVNPVALLDERLLPPFRSALYRIAVEGAGRASRIFFTFYGDELRLAEELRADEKMFESLLIPLLKSRNVPGLHWLVRAFNDIGGLLSAVSRLKSVETFKEALMKEYKADVKDGASSRIAALTRMFQV